MRLALCLLLAFAGGGVLGFVIGVYADTTHDCHTIVCKGPNCSRGHVIECR
jgi:hypothetical protein